ncbi:MAG: substrate-binding domain-containing protein [Acetobacteraceae bacterium]|nr:substrate-binding domain-containing protein [Acetobacteraceae bacterium]
MRCARPRLSQPPTAVGLVRPAVLVVLLLSSFGIARAAPQQVTETGSTLMLPLMQRWAKAYAEVSPEPHVTAATDSGAGIAAAIHGTAQIGASDAYMSDVEVARHPGILNIPLAISAQTVNYNLPGLSATLRLIGPVLA